MYTNQSPPTTLKYSISHTLTFFSEDPFIEETPPSEPPVLTQAMETMAAQKAYKGQGKTYIHPTMAQHKEDTENAEAETNLVTEDEDITEAKDFEEILSAGEESKFADSKIEDLTLEELVSEE